MTMTLDRPMKPEHLTILVGPPDLSGAAPVDVRSVKAAKELMEFSARRAFATRARLLPVRWPTVRASWEGLVLTISAEVANG